MVELEGASEENEAWDGRGKIFIFMREMMHIFDFEVEDVIDYLLDVDDVIDHILDFDEMI